MKNLPRQEDQRKRKAESGPAYGKKTKLDPGVGRYFVRTIFSKFEWKWYESNIMLYMVTLDHPPVLDPVTDPDSCIH